MRTRAWSKRALLVWMRARSLLADRNLSCRSHTVQRYNQRLSGHDVADGTKWCYSVAFGLLALASAVKVGVAAARAPLTALLAVAEDKFYQPEFGLYIDSFNADFSVAASYRGQNANMHMHAFDASPCQGTLCSPRCVWCLRTLYATSALLTVASRRSKHAHVQIVVTGTLTLEHAHAT